MSQLTSFERRLDARLEAKLAPVDPRLERIREDTNRLRGAVSNALAAARSRMPFFDRLDSDSRRQIVDEILSQRGMPSQGQMELGLLERGNAQSRGTLSNFAVAAQNTMAQTLSAGGELVGLVPEGTTRRMEAASIGASEASPVAGTAGQFAGAALDPVFAAATLAAPPLSIGGRAAQGGRAGARAASTILSRQGAQRIGGRALAGAAEGAVSEGLIGAVVPDPGESALESALERGATGAAVGSVAAPLLGELVTQAGRGLNRFAREARVRERGRNIADVRSRAAAEAEALEAADPLSERNRPGRAITNREALLGASGEPGPLPVPQDTATDPATGRAIERVRGVYDFSAKPGPSPGQQSPLPDELVFDRGVVTRRVQKADPGTVADVAIEAEGSQQLTPPQQAAADAASQRVATDPKARRQYLAKVANSGKRQVTANEALDSATTDIAQDVANEAGDPTLFDEVIGSVKRVLSDDTGAVPIPDFGPVADELGRRFGRVADDMARWVQDPKISAEKLVTSIDKRLARFSPALSARVQRLDAEITMKAGRRADVVMGLDQSLSRLGLNGRSLSSSRQARELKIALANGDFKRAEMIVKARATETGRASDGQRAIRQIADTRKILDEMAKEAREVGFEFGIIKDFWPRGVRGRFLVSKADAINRIRNHFGLEDAGPFEDALRKFTKDHGRAATADEQIDIINRIVAGRGPMRAGGTGPSPLRERSVTMIDDEIADLYHNPIESVNNYVNRMTSEIEKRRFLGSRGGDAITRDSIGDLVKRLHDGGQISAGGMREVADMIEARMLGDVLSPNTWVSTYKDLTYGLLLGNPVTAMVQLGDIGVSAWREIIDGDAAFGVIPRDTIRGLFDQRIKLEDLGLHDVAAELSTRDGASAYTRQLMKISGFSLVDRIGKQTNINRAWKSAQRRARKNPTAFRERWSDFFEGQTDELIADLQAGRLTDNVKLLTFYELSKVQPISLSAMPEAYLRSPNGRVFYMLKTFALRQANMVIGEIASRARQGADALQRGDVKLASKKILESVGVAASYALVVGGGNHAVSEMKDFIKGVLLGQEIEEQPELTGNGIADGVISNTMGAIGLNRYLADSLWVGRPFQAVTPPTTVFEGLAGLPRVVQSVVNGDMTEQEYERFLRTQALPGPLKAANAARDLLISDLVPNPPFVRPSGPQPLTR